MKKIKITAVVSFLILLLMSNCLFAMDSEKNGGIFFKGSISVEPDMSSTKSLKKYSSGYVEKISKINDSLVSKTKQQTKERLLNQYIPDLSKFQSVGFTVDVKGGEKVILDIPVAAHFKDKEGREKVVIYNSQIPNVLKIFRARLQSEYENSLKIRKDKLQYVPLPNFLIPDFICPSKKLIVDYADNQVILGNSAVWIKNPTAPQNTAESLADICVCLRHLARVCGTDLENTTTPCAFIMDVEAIRKCETGRVWIERLNTPTEYYAMVEKGFYEIANSSLSNKDEVIALDKCLDEFIRVLNPRASDKQTIDFCFALSRVDYYLSMLEKAKWQRTAEELEVMIRLREKIEALYIEHRFMFVRSESPILGILVDYAQVIADRDDRKMVFIDRAEVQQRFIKRVEEALDTRATSITRKFDFQVRSPAELQKLANELQPENYQEMIDKMQEQILNLTEEKDREKAAAEAGKAKVALSVTKEGIKLAIAAFVGESAGVSNPSVDSCKNDSGKLKSSENFTKKDVEDYISEEKKIKSEEQKIDPNYHLLHPNFDNPKNIVVDSLSTTQTPERPIDYGYSNNYISIRKPNLTAIGKLIDDQGLKPEDVDTLLESMSHYLKSLHLEGKINLRENQKKFIEHIKQGETEYQNLFLLYIKLLRLQLLDRDDFTGIIIDEKIPKISDGRADHLREYFIYEIKKLEKDL